MDNSNKIKVICLGWKEMDKQVAFRVTECRPPSTSLN